MKASLLVCAAAVLSAGCALGVRHEDGARPDAAPTPRKTAAPGAGLPASPALVTADAPDFTADAVMPDDSFGTLTLSSFRGKYVILFFYPMDFTFVCPTEIIAFDDKLDEFRQRDCAVIAVSVDSHFTHKAWKSTPRDKGGLGPIRYPLVADITKQIAQSYGVLYNKSVALRGLFLIDRKGKVRHALVNDLPLGRNVDEALRTLDALIFVETHGDEVCPANWRPGRKTVKTTFDGIADYLKEKK